MSKIANFIAFRYLRAKKSDSFISLVSTFSLLGICLGVAALIVVMSVMNGFHQELSKKIIGFDGEIYVFSQNNRIYDYKNLQSKIKKGSNEVINVYPVIERQVLANSSNHSVGALVRSMPLKDLQQDSFIGNSIVRGSIAELKENEIIIGYELAKSLLVTLGSEVKVIIPEVNNTLIGSIPRFKTLKVAAIFKAGMYQYDSTIIFMHLSMAQTLFKLDKAVNMMQIYIKNPEQASVIARKIENLLPPDLTINDWQNKNSVFFNALKTERVVMFIILALIVLVAAFNIISGLTMMVKDKTADIAILRTMGMSRKEVVSVFLICGSTIGVIGTCSGVILGYLIANNLETLKKFLEETIDISLFNPVVYYLSELPCKFLMSDLINVALLSLVLSFLATIYPAFRASGLKPIEALRYK